MCFSLSTLFEKERYFFENHCATITSGKAEHQGKHPVFPDKAWPLAPTTLFGYRATCDCVYYLINKRRVLFSDNKTPLVPSYFP
jgi:hypothetical protein